MIRKILVWLFLFVVNAIVLIAALKLLRTAHLSYPMDFMARLTLFLFWTPFASRQLGFKPRWTKVMAGIK